MQWEQLSTSFHYFDYDAAAYPFESLIQKMMTTNEPLDRLHESVTRLQEQLKAQDIKFDDPSQKNTFSTDQSSCFHRLFYNSGHLFEEFTRLYHKFVRECVLPIFDSSETHFAIQNTPTIRFQTPKISALGDNFDIVPKQTYIDKKVPEGCFGLHNDSLYKHPSGEINFIVSLTEMHDTLFVETGINTNEYLPVKSFPGRFFQFYGNKMFHFNKINQSDQTRVSIDFRVIPMSKYQESESGKSMTSARSFKIGKDGYYTLMERTS